MFFKPAVDSLYEKGHELFCTTREYREAVELARIKNMHLEIVGRHGGANKYDKLQASTCRISKLAQKIRKFDPNLAISFSSPECARVAYGLGIRHIGFNDSPHAEAVTKLTIPLLSHLYCPWVIPRSAWVLRGISKKAITTYKALDPAAWLKRNQVRTSVSPDLNRKLSPDKKNILIRLEELKASYIADKKLVNRISIIDNVINRLFQSVNILILCRYADQVSEIRKRYKHKAHVLQDVIDGTSLISLVDIFVGAGGTMTTEAALLGKPTISISPFRFYVEKYLVRSGLAQRASNSTDLLRLLNKMIADNNFEIRQKKIAKSILDKMEDPITKLMSYVNQIA